MFKLIISLICSFVFIGCSKDTLPLNTVGKVNINKYLGTWYEIARYDHSFEKGCTNVSAFYSLRKDGSINVINSCTKEDGTKKEATGVAYATNKNNTKLKVSFFRPFYGDYWILMLDKDYTYALIGEPNREYLWILSRTKTLNANIKNKILQKIEENKFDETKLIWTKQSM
ncbi:lipocalin family protein [Sulfurospirillum arcachonense]|uniref:lipocalin family protein n=1 Tax=Sulfurospirillum arcachonense TaxID=57666 RepID=UPI0004BC5C7D|nr:lipocalin family protein [Sulfurospirillum arcachonense]